MNEGFIMEIGHIISIVSIVVSLLVIVISGLIGLIIKGNSAKREALKESLETEIEDRKTDIRDMKNDIQVENQKVHTRCNHIESEINNDREKRHESDLKMINELSDIKGFMSAINAKLEALS